MTIDVAVWGILALAGAVLYLAPEMEFVKKGLFEKIPYVRLFGKYMFFLFAIVAVFEASISTSLPIVTTTNSISTTTNVPLFCNGAAVLTLCGTTNEIITSNTTVTTAGSTANNWLVSSLLYGLLLITLVNLYVDVFKTLIDGLRKWMRK